MADEILTTKQQWYDLSKYKDEIQQFISKKRLELDVISQMEKTYNILYSTVYAGTEEADTERFPYSAEQFKVYKSAIIEACLSGYSALLEANGNDAYSMLKVPELKSTMTQQFKSMSLLENLSNDSLDDWCLKGEAAGYFKLIEDKEEYRIKETLTDEATGKPFITFTLQEGVLSNRLEFVPIDPLDLYIDAIDYDKDPVGCTKIVRSWIDPKTLLSSNAYPLLSQEDKKNIITAVGQNGKGSSFFNWSPSFIQQPKPETNQTDKARIEVLTFYGDYVTNDLKVLNNIKAVLVGNKIAYADYNTINVQRIVYAPYKIDRRTHRGVSPIACVKPVNKLLNRATDMFLKNLEDISVPVMMYQKGSVSANQVKEFRNKKEIEYIDIGGKPEFWCPPPAATNGLQLLELVLNQCKNVLGLNNYMAGDTSGAVRTARESAILSQKANARMRVETDVFSYKFLLPLFVCFYAFNRELALAAKTPLAPIYADERLNVSISTNASRADKEGELNRLLEMLQLPIAQMIFSNLTPEQITMAVRYLMAKAELGDVDNLLELIDENGNPQYPVNPEGSGGVGDNEPAAPNSPTGMGTMETMQQNIPSAGEAQQSMNLPQIPTDVPLNEIL